MKSVKRLSFLVPLLLGAGCAEEIDTIPPGPAVTMAVFDFSASPPQFPIPTDLAMDPVTGLLNIPPSDPTTTSPAQIYLNDFLNTLNGWPAVTPGEVHFTAPLDAKTVNDKTIVVLELDPTDPTKVTPVTNVTYEYVELTGGTSLVRIYPQGGKWTRGSRYVVFVVGGASGLKDKDGKQVYRSPYFDQAAGDKPLCEWDENRSWDSSSMSCTTPASGAPAIGCCTFNHNSAIDASIRASVRASAPDDMTLEEVRKLAKATVLETVTQFEFMRRNFSQMLGMAAQFKINGDDIAVLWSFKIQDMNQAIFDPTATPPLGPFPNDFVKDPQTGLLNLPINPALSKAEQAYYAYLNTLDGFPMNFPGQVDFIEELNDKNIDNGVMVFSIDVTAKPPKATKLDNVVVKYDPTKKQLVVTRQGGLDHAKTHVMVAVGGAGGLKNKDTKHGQSPVATAYMALAISPHPLCENYDATKMSCGAPTVNVFLDDPKSVPNGQTASEKAAQSEVVRLMFAPMMDAILTADTNLKREDVSAFWAFTTTTMTMVNVDPENGKIPFPSDLILDPKTGKVNIPATPGESLPDAMLRQGLNTMDGFTTQGTYFVPVAGKVDPASTTLPNAALTLNVAGPIPAPAPMVVAADNTAGAITVKPVAPLQEKSRYAVILTSKRKDGTRVSQGGLKDDKGNYVAPSPATVFLRSAEPLYDQATKKSLISFLDDATAAQLEAARLEAAPHFAGLAFLGVQREDVVGMWTMTTMSITKEMQDLRGLPYGMLKPTENKLVGTLDKTLASWPTTYMDTPKTGVGAIVASGTYKSWWALNPATGSFTDPTQGSVVDVPFLLTLPSGAMPVTGWPLVIYVQSLYQSKAEALAIASANALKGMATISFDLPYHGARSWCVKDDECEGTCDVATGTCSTGLADKDNNGIEDASGNEKFVALTNPFAIRDNMRQSVIDASALLRAVVTGGASGIIPAGSVKFDPTKVTVAGYSTGAIIATNWLAVETAALRGALNSPGLRFAEIFFGPDSGKDWTDIKKGVFQAQGITEGSIEALQLVTTFQWIMEPADPGNFGRHITKAPLPKVPPKTVILQQAELDEGVPVRFSDPLAKEIGVVTTKTFYKGQAHKMFKLGDPDKTATQACRSQMATFLQSGTVCTPAVANGKYTGACN